MSLLHIAGGATEDKLYPEDVFVSYLRTGTGADVVVTTGIDYTKGFMSWTKGRSGATDHAIYDSARGVTKDLVSNSTAAETTQTTGLKAVSTTGHTIGSLAKMNTSGATYVDWVFRKAPKFFDVVTYTGNGIAGRQIPHSLGITPGMIVIKRTDSASSIGWAVYHRSLGGTQWMQLNKTNAAASADNIWNNTEPTASVFTVGTGTDVNTSGAQYVAYLFAHDPSADGIIQCGSFTTDGSGIATVNLGWESQYVLVKRSDNSGGWYILDEMRGSLMSNPNGSIDLPYLYAHAANAESSTFHYINKYATGFSTIGSALGYNTVYVYMAIRRPMKVPTSGTEVYRAVNYTGTGVSGSIDTTYNPSFAPDSIFIQGRNSPLSIQLWCSIYDRLRGKYKSLLTQSASAEQTNETDTLSSFDQKGVSFGADEYYVRLNRVNHTFVYHSFKRAKGFFDIVCYTGTGVARTINHNLGVVPELMIVKQRSASTYAWLVYNKTITATKYLSLNAASQAGADSVPWSNTEPTSNEFTVGLYNSVSSVTYVAYLFASCPGVSKVGSYTGNGSSQTINCGFSAGARFVLCKRTDSTGDWYIWDTARGIIAANDPHLSLNTNDAEVTTDDSVDPEASGFIVNQNTATNINVNGASYIFLAIS